MFCLIVPFLNIDPSLASDLLFGLCQPHTPSPDHKSIIMWDSENQPFFHHRSETMGTDVESFGSSSPSASPGGSSPLTTPELSDDGFDIDHLPPPLDQARAPDAELHASHSADGTPTFILVIGGLGYIGSHTVLELLREGHNGTSARGAQYLTKVDIDKPISDHRRQPQQ